MADLLFFFFVCGGTNFNSPIKGYEDLHVYCPRCHNFSLVPIHRREFFTFCYVPVIPTSWGDDLQCTICPYNQVTSREQLDQIRRQPAPLGTIQAIPGPPA
ncbi:hypothetical protein V1514DRAFT_323250 [Lipomyces japonicus]|uniref:uncharacterized protein n=1 Tax=Lipomyces japonicus TaxID=56871 RepID=UPI0034CE529A